MPEPKQILEPVQLLVEGNDQRNFFEAYTKYLKIRNIQIQDFGGINELRSFLLAFVKMPKFSTVRSIGVVRDAEQSAQGAAKSVRHALKKAKLCDIAGKSKDTGLKINVFILPDCSNPGMLETLLCQTLSGSSIDRCIDDFFECAEALPNISIDRPHKARAYAYLATRTSPHHSVGIAAKRGDWNLDHEAFNGIREFMMAL